jgi:hypothetical protein
MLINIGDADKNGKRVLTVSDETGEFFKQSVADTAHGHKLAKVGLKHGWDSPEMAKAVKG